MDRDMGKERGGYPHESDFATLYLNRANQHILCKSFPSARQNLKYAKENGASVVDISLLEEKIKISETMAETEKNIKEAQKYLSWGHLEKAIECLDKAKTSGVLTELVSELEKQIKLTEDAKHNIDLVSDCLSKRNTDDAVNYLKHLDEIMCKINYYYVHEQLMNKVSKLQEKLKKQIESEEFMKLALECLEKGLFQEAKNHINCAYYENSLPYQLFHDVNYLIEGKIYMSKAEVSLSKRQFCSAESYLNNAKRYNYPVVEINKFQQRIEDAKMNVDKKYTGVHTTPIIAPLLSSSYDTQRNDKIPEAPMDTMDLQGPSNYQLTGNLTEDKKSVADNIKDKPLYKQHENDKIMQEINEIPDRPKRTYFEECTRNSVSENNNMSFSTLNEAFYFNETHFDESSSSSFIGQENKLTSSSDVMDIEYGDSIPHNNSSNDQINVHQPDSKQLALLQPIAKMTISFEANNQKRIVQKHPAFEVKTETSLNSMKKPPVPEKPNSSYKSASASKIDTENNANDLNNQNHAHTFERVPEMRRPNNFEIKNQEHSDQKLQASVSQKLDFKNTETQTPVHSYTEPLCEKKDLKNVQMQKGKEDTKPLETKTVNSEKEVDNDDIPLPKKCEFLVKTALKDGCIENAERILQIAEKLYPEHDFAFIRSEIYTVKALVTDKQVTKEITPKPIKMNIQETKTNEVSGKKGNHAEYTMVHDEKELPKVHKSEHSMTTRGRSTEVRKPEYSLRTREKSAVRPKKSDDSKINPNYYENKENRSNNDSANREQADYCLKIAKQALEANDIEKAERLATKADRMYPSEEAKVLLAKILQMKSSVKDREVKGDNTHYSECQIEDKEEAKTCLEKAFTAHVKGDIDKCKRFLRKAQSFDKSIDIGVYMSDLDQKKKDHEAQKKAAENSSKSYTEILWVKGKSVGKSIINTVFGTGDSAEETKTAQENKNKEHCSYKDCLNNNPSPPEAKKTENELQKAGTSSQTDSETDQDAAKDTSSKRGNAKEPENKWEWNNELKAKELENKAMACCDGGDYEQALLLLESAKGLHPDKQKVQDLIVQVQEAALTSKNTTTAKNQNEAKERGDENSKSHTIEMENINSSANQNVQQNSESPKGTDSYVKNMTNFYETFHVPKTGHNSQENIQRPSRQFFNSNHSGRGRGFKPENTSNYILRARPSRSLNRKDNFDGAINLRHMGVKAFHAKQYEDAEKWLTESENLYPNHETRNLINDVRKEKNRRGSMS